MREASSTPRQQARQETAPTSDPAAGRPRLHSHSHSHSGLQANCNMQHTIFTSPSELRIELPQPSTAHHHPERQLPQPPNAPSAPPARVSLPEYPLSSLLEELFPQGPKMKRGADPDYAPDSRKRGRPTPPKSTKGTAPGVAPNSPVEEREGPTGKEKATPVEATPFLNRAITALMQSIIKVSNSTYRSLQAIQLDESEQVVLEEAGATRNWPNRSEIDDVLQLVELLYARDAPRLTKAVESLKSLQWEANVIKELMKIGDSGKEDSTIASVIYAANLMAQGEKIARAAPGT